MTTSGFSTMLVGYQQGLCTALGPGHCGMKTSGNAGVRGRVCFVQASLFVMDDGESFCWPRSALEIGETGGGRRGCVSMRAMASLATPLDAFPGPGVYRSPSPMRGPLTALRFQCSQSR